MKKHSILRILLIIAILGITYQFGIRPILGGQAFYGKVKTSNWASSKLVNEEGIYDVIVVGEEPEGIASAISAARSGAKTLLIARGGDLGGSVSAALRADLEVSRGLKDKILNRGISSVLNSKLGENFSIEKYKTAVTDLVKSEKKLDIIYYARVTSLIMNNNVITGVNVSIKDEKEIYKGKRFIDATLDGELLTRCDVPYFVGSEDINVKKSFLPVALNFIVKDIKPGDIKGINSLSKEKLKSITDKYILLHINTRINNFKAIYQSDGKAIIQGLEVFDLDIMDEGAVAQAYKDASVEAEEFAKFLKAVFKEFQNSKFVRVADKFNIRESRHFFGEYLLSVNDILDNQDFDDKIAMGSYPVEAGKFVNTSEIIIGKPEQYSIPLGCIIPKKVDNLLMVGSKASYSSLASSSAGTLSVSVMTGQSAGIVAVYSLINNITPRDILDTSNRDRRDELKGLLKKQSIYWPEFAITNINASNWAVRKLNTLGLITGGTKNNYKLQMEASQKDMATLLISGVSRLAPSKYSLDLDTRLRPYYINEKITPDKAGEILAAFYGSSIERDNPFDKACERGYIYDAIRRKIDDQKYLSISDMFYLSAYNIEMYTGKDITE